MLTRTPMKRGGRNTGPSLDVVEAILVRAGFSCEWCNHMIGDRRGEDWSVQHRVARGMGGTRRAHVNLPSALGILCGSGTTGCHGEIESRRAAALESGWLVPSVTDPAKVPILLHQERFVYLTNGGEYSDNPPAVGA